MNTIGAITFLAREAVAAVGHMIAGRAFEAYSDDCDPLADTEADRDVWEPAELGRVVPLLEDIRNTLARMSIPGGGAWGDLLDPAAPTRSAWDIETGEGLAYAAEMQDEVARTIERHRYLGERYGELSAAPHAYIVCRCRLEFTDFEVWARHVGDVVLTTVNSFPAVAEQPAAAGTGGLPPTTPHGRREAGRPTNPTK